MLDSAEDGEGSSRSKVAGAAAAQQVCDGVVAASGGRPARDGGDVAAIPASEITLCLQPDGRPECLGEGAFGTVSCLLVCGRLHLALCCLFEQT